MTKRDEYTARMKTQLDELNAGLSRLEADAAAVKADARAQYQEQMQKVRAAGQAARAQFDSVVASSEEAWAQLVAEMEKLRDAFKHSFNYFKSQI